MDEMKKYREKIRSVLSSQKFGVLATHEVDGPYTNLITFSYSGDMKKIFFVTNQNTRKFRNLTKNNKISFMVDNRKNDSSDFKEAVAINFTGKAIPMDRNVSSYRDAIKLLLNKNPELKNFMAQDDSIIIQVNISKCYLAYKFQKIITLDASEL